MYGGDAALSAEVPPGYGDWPIPEADLKGKYFVPDLDKAKQLMSAAGMSNGFSVELQSISAPPDYTQIAEVLKEQLSAIKIDIKVVPLEIGTFAKNNADGTFEWQQTGRGMRGDVSNYMADFDPTTTTFKNWFGEGWKNAELTTLIDQGSPRSTRRSARISTAWMQGDPDRRSATHDDLPAVQVSGGAQQGEVTCTWRTPTSTAACAKRGLTARCWVIGVGCWGSVTCVALPSPETLHPPPITHG